MAFQRTNGFTLNNAYEQQKSIATGGHADNGVQSHQPFKLPEGMKYFSWGKEPGIVTFNILPFMVKATNSAAFMYHLDVHEIPNPANKRAHRFICLSNIGKKCPICEEKQAQDTGDNYDAISGYIPKHRTIFLVQPVVNGVPQNEIHLLETAQKQAGNGAFPQKLMAMATMMANGTGIVRFADPDIGKTVCVQTTKEFFNGHAFIAPAAVMFQDRAPLSDEILAKIPDFIEDVFNISDSDYDNMKTLMNGGEMTPETPVEPSIPQTPINVPMTEEIGYTPQQYAAMQGQMVPPAHPVSGSTPGYFNDSDFNRDPYSRPTRDFPSEPVAEPAPQPAPVSNGFVRSRF